MVLADDNAHAMPMAPPRLVPGRRRWRQVVLWDGVAGTRGRNVVRVKINMRRMRWKLRRMDVSASAWRAAIISPRAVLSRLSFLFLSFPVVFFSVESFICHRGSGCYHASQTMHSRNARAQENLFFLAHPIPSFHHDEPTQSHHHLYIHIPSHCVSLNRWM